MFFFSAPINEAAIPQFFKAFTISKLEGSKFFSKTLNLILTLCTIITLVIIIGFNYFETNLSEKSIDMTDVKTLLVLLIPFVYLSALTTYFAAILNALEKFVAQNVMKAIGAMFGTCLLVLTVTSLQIRAIIFSIELSLLLLTISQLYLIRAEGIRYIPFEKISFNITFKKVFGGLVTVFLLMSLYLVFEKWVFLRGGEGFVSAFLYSHKIFIIPHQVFFAGLVSIIWTKFMKSVHEKGIGQAMSKFFSVLELAVFLSLYLSVFLSVYSEEIMRALFLRGKFDINSLEKTRDIFRILILSLPFLVGKDLILRVVATLQKARYITIINLLYNIVAFIGLLIVMSYKSSTLSVSIILISHIFTFMYSLYVLSRLSENNRVYFNGALNLKNLIVITFCFPALYTIQIYLKQESILLSLVSMSLSFILIGMPVWLISFKRYKALI
jgi:peptidoglycan biosynthesis protein MviN/MurJ (putative lipid II flippase)